MKLTIGIPNFNGGNNLKEAIESCQHIKLPKEEKKVTPRSRKKKDHGGEACDVKSACVT